MGIAGLKREKSSSQDGPFRWHIGKTMQTGKLGSYWWPQLQGSLILLPGSPFNVVN